MFFQEGGFSLRRTTSSPTFLLYTFLFLFRAHTLVAYNNISIASLEKRTGRSAQSDRGARKVLNIQELNNHLERERERDCITGSSAGSSQVIADRNNRALLLTAHNFQNNILRLLCFRYGVYCRCRGVHYRSLHTCGAVYEEE